MAKKGFFYWFLVSLLAVITLSLCLLVFKTRVMNSPLFIPKPGPWAIGVVEGPDPLHFDTPKNITNPILTAADVTDIPASFVADPFMIREDGLWHMFFEVLNDATQQGDIAHATSKDGLQWSYTQVVLDEAFHLSYPYVFKWEGDIFMIPESHQDLSIRLYKAESFPLKWTLVSELLQGSYADASVVFHENTWFLFASPNNGELRLFHASALTGPWEEHPLSPVIKGDETIARPGGRMIHHDGALLRYTQNDLKIYGNSLSAYEITTLTPTEYSERPALEAPMFQGTGSGWNATGMHHVDPHRQASGRWLAPVDGYGVLWDLNLSFSPPKENP